ncbi:MAG: TFIIB-type zinc finger domain-containing protein [Coriobacteriaceae bacterium]|nr:TFIIB-type zinc finger domain-containing protein [Coriobacteriaceae bacterium]
MESIVCSNCMSNEFDEENGKLICKYCGTAYKTIQKNISSIGIASDVEVLLEKCRKNPAGAKRFANLILDIDPLNSEARKFL